MLLKHDTLPMGEYLVTYSGKEKKGVHIHYTIDYLRRTAGGVEKAFTLEPVVQLNARMGNVAEPATKHFAGRDIYTHITYADLEDASDGDTAAWGAAKDLVMKIGDTAMASTAMLVLQGLDKDPDRSSRSLQDTDLAVAALVEITDAGKRKRQASPVFVIRNQIAFTREDTVGELGLRLGFTRIDPETETFTLTLAEKKSNKREFIIMKAIVFPYINILWLGCVLMVAGTLIAAVKRFRAGREKPPAGH
jgi:cytochrome c-type biogenesis protein CcmF